MFQGFIRFFDPIRSHPQIGTMLVIVGLVMSGNAIVAPVLSLYADSFASSSTLIGMVITVFGVARLFVNYPSGALSQRIGRRPLMLSGLVVIVVGSVGAALAHSIETLLIWRFVQGLGSGIYMSASYAAMADMTEDGTRGRVMALQQGSMWLGIGVGPILGGFLAEYLGLPAPFWAYGAVCGLAALLVWLQLGETRDEAYRTPPRTKIDAAESTDPVEQPADGVHTVALRHNAAFILMCAISFGLFFTRTASQWLLIPLLANTRYGMGVDIIGLALAVLAVGTFIMIPITGNLIDRYGARPVIVVSLLLTTVALAVIALGTTVATFWAGMFILGIGLGVSNPAVSAYSIAVVPKSSYGPAMGMLRTWGDVGFVLGPVLVGLLDDFGGTGAVGGILLSAALLAVLTLPFFLKDLSASKS